MIMGRRDNKRTGRTLVVLGLSIAFLCNGCAAAEYLRAGAQAQSEYNDGLVLYQTKEYARAIEITPELGSSSSRASPSGLSGPASKTGWVGVAGGLETMLRLNGRSSKPSS